MSFIEILGLVLSGVGLFASILGLFLAHASRHNGNMTRILVREMQDETRQMLERMDQRADERHREVIEAIKALRA